MLSAPFRLPIKLFSNFFYYNIRTHIFIGIDFLGKVCYNRSMSRDNYAYQFWMTTAAVLHGKLGLLCAIEYAGVMQV